MAEKSLLSRWWKRGRFYVLLALRYPTYFLFRSHCYRLLGFSLHEKAAPHEVIECYQPQRLSLPDPTNNHWYFLEKQHAITLPKHGVLSLEKGIATPLGGNLNAKRRVVTTFLNSHNLKREEHRLLSINKRDFRPRIFTSSCDVVNLTHPWHYNFYHWLQENLVRLHLLDKAGISCPTYFTHNNLPFQKESLALLGISQEQVISAQEYDAVSAPIVHSPSIPRLPTKWGVAFLRRKILPQIEELPWEKRYYLARGDAAHRRITNEKELIEEVLTPLGFEVLLLSNLSLKEQIAKIRSAKVIVAPHGAGLAHLAFCRPQTLLFEIFSPEFLATFYWVLAAQAEVRYNSHIAQGLPLTKQDLLYPKERNRVHSFTQNIFIEKVHKKSMYSDISIDLNAFQTDLERSLLERKVRA